MAAEEELRKWTYEEVPGEEELGQKKSQIRIEDKKWCDYWSEIRAVFAVSMGMLCTGSVFGWAGPALPQLLSPDAISPITTEQAAYLTGGLMIGAMPGSILGAMLGDYIGRKKSIMFLSLPFLTSQLLLAFGTNIYHLFAARIIGGMAVGSVYALVPIYISEVSTPSIRGILGTAIGMFFTLGVVFQYLVGLFNTIQVTGMVSTILPVIFLVLMLNVPESPYYLLLIDDEDGARSALKQLRQTNNVGYELKRLADDVQSQKAEKSGVMDLFLSPDNRKALLINTGIIIAQQFSGITPILAYSQVTFNTLDIGISAEVCGIALVCMNFAVTILCAILVDNMGRKKLFIISSLGTAISLTISAVFFYLQETHFEGINRLGYIPVASLILLKFSWGIGFGCLPYIISGELFATTVKASGCSYVSVIGSLFSFMTLKFYQSTSEVYGISFPYLCFSVCCIGFALFVYLFLPETKGKTLEEIQERLKRGNKGVRSEKKTGGC